MSEGTSKGWIGPLLDNRVLFLQKELQNGGRGLTFTELAKLANQAHPAKINTSEKLVQRVQLAVQKNIELKNRDDAFNIELPRASGMTKWLEKREAERLRFIKQAQSRKNYNNKLKKLGVKTLGVGRGHRSDLAEEEVITHVKTCKRGHPRLPENLYGNGACKLCNTITSRGRTKKFRKKGGRMSALEAITRSQESSLDNIASELAEIPPLLREVLEDVTLMMQRHKFRSLELTVQNGGGHVVLHPLPQPIIAQVKPEA